MERKEREHRTENGTIITIRRHWNRRQWLVRVQRRYQASYCVSTHYHYERAFESYQEHIEANS